MLILRLQSPQDKIISCLLHALPLVGSGAREVSVIDSSEGFQLKVSSKLLSGCAPVTLTTGSQLQTHTTWLLGGMSQWHQLCAHLCNFVVHRHP